MSIGLSVGVQLAVAQVSFGESSLVKRAVVCSRFHLKRRRRHLRTEVLCHATSERLGIRLRVSIGSIGSGVPWGCSDELVDNWSVFMPTKQILSI